MDNAQYVNKFQVTANAQAQEVFLTLFQVQPTWDESSGVVTGVNIVDISKVFMSVVSAKALIEVLSRCISDSETKRSKTEE